MRRPLDNEFSAEDRSLTRRWAVAVASFYSTILIVAMIAAALVSSRADKVTVVASAAPKQLIQDRSGRQPYRPLPYGSLPNVRPGSLAER